MGRRLTGLEAHFRPACKNYMHFGRFFALPRLPFLYLFEKEER